MQVVGSWVRTRKKPPERVRLKRVAKNGFAHRRDKPVLEAYGAHVDRVERGVVRQRKREEKPEHRESLKHHLRERLLPINNIINWGVLKTLQRARREGRGKEQKEN